METHHLSWMRYLMMAHPFSFGELSNEMSYLMEARYFGLDRCMIAHP